MEEQGIYDRTGKGIGWFGIYPGDTGKKQEILRKLLPNAGAGCYVKSPFICEYGDYIFLGRNFFANYNCKLIDGGKITFGDNVLVCPGVTIGDNCVIGAGSVVVKDIPANSFAAGNPCRVIRGVSDNDR